MTIDQQASIIDNMRQMMNYNVKLGSLIEEQNRTAIGIERDAVAAILKQNTDSMRVLAESIIVLALATETV